MSKGHSGLFRETNGDKIARGINSAIQKEKAFEYAKDIYENGTTAEKKTINTITGLMVASNCIIPLKTLYYLVIKLMKEFFLRKN